MLVCPLQACVAGMFEYRDFGASKQHLRDFLVQVLNFKPAHCVVRSQRPRQSSSGCVPARRSRS
jgi:hypothetical protein